MFGQDYILKTCNRVVMSHKTFVSYTYALLRMLTLFEKIAKAIEEKLWNVKIQNIHTQLNSTAIFSCANNKKHFIIKAHIRMTF